MRLTATLPFLRIDGGVDVVLGEHGELAERGVIKKIAVDPSTSDGVPRLAVDVALASDTQPYGASRRAAVEARRRRPRKLPPPCGHPLPSVLVSPGLVRDVRKVEERPPRRRVHSTAEISRRPGLGLGAGRPRRSWSAAARRRPTPARRAAAHRPHRRAGRGRCAASVPGPKRSSWGSC